MRIGLEDVAREAGVGLGTASRALSGQGKVAAATRERVLRVAANLGYQTNAAASLLASNRAQAGKRLTIAVIESDHFHQEDFINSVDGTGLDLVFDEPQHYRSPAEMLRVLHARGIDGLFIHFGRSPWSEELWLAVDWSRFAVIKQSRVFPKLAFHLIRHSAFDFMRVSLQGLVQNGFRKIAVLLYPSESAADDEARLGAMLAADYRLRDSGGWVRSRLWAGSDPIKDDPETRKWLKQQRPDAILTFLWLHWYPLTRAGWRFPEDAAFATVMRPHPDSDPDAQIIAGCSWGQHTMHKPALEQLRRMIGQNDRGFPKIPMEHVVEPIWVPGSTVPEIR